jgi:hypothetical protein
MSSTRRRVLAALVVLLGVTLAIAPPTQAKLVSIKPLCKVTSGVDLGGPEPVPVELPGALEPKLLAEFAVLRRAQTDDDLIPPLNAVAEDLSGELASYYPAQIRELLTLANGDRYFLVPGFPRPNVPPKTTCSSRALQKQRDAERARELQEERTRAAQPAFCVTAASSGRIRLDLTDVCETFAELEQSRRAFLFAGDGERIVELAPDGVASVRIRFPAVPAITVAVAENDYTFVAPGAAVRRAKRLLKQLTTFGKPGPGGHIVSLPEPQARELPKALEAGEPTKIEWLDAAGRLVRSIAHPRPAF